jgi:hypothetical protein
MRFPCALARAMPARVRSPIFCDSIFARLDMTAGRCGVGRVGMRWMDADRCGWGLFISKSDCAQSYRPALAPDCPKNVAAATFRSCRSTGSSGAFSRSTVPRTVGNGTDLKALGGRFQLRVRARFLLFDARCGGCPAPPVPLSCARQQQRVGAAHLFRLALRLRLSRLVPSHGRLR